MQKWKLSAGTYKRRIFPTDRHETPQSAYFISPAAANMHGEFFAVVLTGVSEVEDMPPIMLERAKLMAAAPDLMEACENAANVLAALATGELTRVDRDSPVLAQLRAAIQKGRTG